MSFREETLGQAQNLSERLYTSGGLERLSFLPENELEGLSLGFCAHLLLPQPK